MVALTWIGLLAAQFLTHQVIPELPFMISDGVVAIGFLLLAIRYASLYLGAAMLLQAALFSLHAAHLSGDTDFGWVNSYFLHKTHFNRIAADDYYYLVLVNPISYCVLFMPIGATAFVGRGARNSREPARPCNG